MKKQHQNLLDLKPRRNLQWETRGNGFVTLIVPKFKNKYLAQWFVPMLAKPNIRVNLDEFGSFVWNKCDGNTPVGQIGEEMAERFNEPLEPMYERIGKFVGKLAGSNFLILEQESLTEATHVNSN